MTNLSDINEKVRMVTDIANILRGPYSSEKYGEVIIPMSIIRRFDCILASKNAQIKKVLEKVEGKGLTPQQLEDIVLKKCGVPFYNSKCVTLEDLVGNPAVLGAIFKEFIASYSISVQNILANLKFQEQVDFMIQKNLLYETVKRFSELDFHPETTDPLTMGYIFEEIIRTYKANAEAGDHYTPREVIELCTDLMVADREKDYKQKGKVLRAYDGCCGTGGMLIVLQRKINELSKGAATVRLFGQDNNPEAYATCCAEMLMLGEEAKNIYGDNTLTEDRFPNQKFDLLITNPPFGVQWKVEKSFVESEARGEKLGDKDGQNRFPSGTPRISDGQLLFLQNLLAKAEENARIAIILNGSPLFSGDAGSGESEIRRYVLESGLLEAIIALPDQMFYNTGISTYIWILSKKHKKERLGKVQLINAVDFYEPQKPKSLGNKRKYISKTNRKKIVELYKEFKENEYSKIFVPKDFGYTKVTIEQPKKDEKGKVLMNSKGKVEIDTAKRDTETIPLKQDIDEYIKKEVLPFVPDAIPDRSKDKIGYEIPFTRYFYKYAPPRPSEDILKEIKMLEKELQKEVDGLLKE